jgi:hypothetical protein
MQRRYVHPTPSRLVLADEFGIVHSPVKTGQQADPPDTHCCLASATPLPTERVPMSTSILPSRRATGVLLVTAALLELVETVLSPLGGGSTRSELSNIAAHQGQFTISVLCGMVAVLLYGPGFLGLGNFCATKAPRLGRFAGWVAAVSMTGFFAVRGVQAAQLSVVKSGLDHTTGAKIIDGVSNNPLGVLILVTFLGGALIGTVSLAVAAWRAGLPRVPAVLLGLFQIVDLAAPGHAGTIVSHTLLLVALVWFATALWSPSLVDEPALPVDAGALA